MSISFKVRLIQMLVVFVLNAHVDLLSWKLRLVGFEAAKQIASDTKHFRICC